ncbi:unnamed protein product [Prorocentrum cordatum]|uniref:Uncharacterized protein n=1 Tax=Prorocentrum cordatum TaxID=2364126 RepID=A0ABN9SQS4_9DINO|nr:unnamed protein product [Polarella glacialis]
MSRRRPRSAVSARDWEMSNGYGGLPAGATAGRPIRRVSALRMKEEAEVGASAARRRARARRLLAAEPAVSKADRGGPGSWQDRGAAARPALRFAAVRGRVPGTMRRRRNAAWHALLVPAGGFARASAPGIVRAAAGPRLGWLPPLPEAAAVSFGDFEAAPEEQCQALGGEDEGRCEDRLENLKGSSVGLDLDEDEGLREGRTGWKTSSSMHKRKFGLNLDEDEGLREGRLEDPKGPCKREFGLDLGVDEGLLEGRLEDMKGRHKRKLGLDMDEDGGLCVDRLAEDLEGMHKHSKFGLDLDEDEGLCDDRLGGVKGRLKRKFDRDLGEDGGLCEDRLDKVKCFRKREVGLDLGEEESLGEDRLEDRKGMRKRKFGLDQDEDEVLSEGRLEDPKGPRMREFGVGPGADASLCEDRMDDLRGLRSRKFGLELDGDEILREDRLEDLKGMRKRKFGLDLGEEEDLCEGRREDSQGPCKRDLGLDLGENEDLEFLSVDELLEAGAAPRMALAVASILLGIPLEGPRTLPRELA